jgi:hypothetical protein
MAIPIKKKNHFYWPHNLPVVKEKVPFRSREGWKRSCLRVEARFEEYVLDPYDRDPKPAPCTDGDLVSGDHPLSISHWEVDERVAFYARPVDNPAYAGASLVGAKESIVVNPAFFIIIFFLFLFAIFFFLMIFFF